MHTYYLPTASDKQVKGQNSGMISYGSEQIAKGSSMKFYLFSLHLHANTPVCLKTETSKGGILKIGLRIQRSSVSPQI
jgi:hypothetical protein